MKLTTNAESKLQTSNARTFKTRFNLSFNKLDNQDQSKQSTNRDIAQRLTINQSIDQLYSNQERKNNKTQYKAYRSK